MYYFYKGEEKFVKGVFYIQYTAIMTEQRHKLGNNILHGIFATLCARITLSTSILYTPNHLKLRVKEEMEREKVNA